MADINRKAFLMQFVYAFILFEFIRAEQILLSAEITSMNCSQQHENSSGMWGDINPNIFYICDPENNMPRQMSCTEGRGFFKGLGYYGCIPFENWPACIPSILRAQNQNNISMELCDSGNLLEPWASKDPNKFYMCVNATTEPILVNCENGKGFVSVVAENSSSSKIVGCANWEKWRAYMQCEQYY